MPTPRKPTQLKVLQGTARADRMNAAEPRPEIALLDPPPHLVGRAREAWQAIAPILARMRVLSVADPVALESLVETYAEIRELRESIAQTGRSYETANAEGGRMVRAVPEVAMLADADRRLLTWLRAFGMTPADRSRVSAAPEDEADTAWAAYG